MRDLKIDCISDTHCQHKQLKLPGGDILICAGDISHKGRPQEIFDFLTWFGDQDYSHLILIPGNHDFGFETDFEIYAQDAKNKGVILLNDSGCEVEGIKVWGSPVQPWFYDWAFNRQRGLEIKKHWDMIPTDTEILVTHGPPYGIGDFAPTGGHVGCEDLYRKILKTNTKLHVFGHIHEGAGYSMVGDTLYVNASSLDGRYKALKPGFIEVLREDGHYYVRVDDIKP